MGRKRLDSVIAYATSDTPCRSQQLVRYFGEKQSLPCGKCDACLREKRERISTERFQEMTDYIQKILRRQPLSIAEIMEQSHYEEETIIQAIRWLLDNGTLQEDERKKLHWQ